MSINETETFIEMHELKKSPINLWLQRCFITDDLRSV